MMTTDKRPVINIKGVKDGLLITLGEGRWSDLEEVLLTTVVERESFLRGAKVALDVGNHILHAAELGGLRDKLSERLSQLGWQTRIHETAHYFLYGEGEMASKVF